MLFKSLAKSSQRYICGYYTTHTLKNKYIKRETIKEYSIRRNDSGINMILRIITLNLLKTKMPDRQINELQKVHQCFVNPARQTMNIPDRIQS